MRGVLLSTLLTLLAMLALGCAPIRAPGPGATLARYATAARAADGAAMDGLLADEVRRRAWPTSGLDEVADEVVAEAEAIQAALDGGKEPTIEVLMAVGEGGGIELLREGGRWRIPSGLP